MDTPEVVERLRSLANPAALDGMSRYGITVDRALGVSMPKLRALAKGLGKNHELALSLWDTGIHDARILASLVDAPAAVTEEQMERWVQAFDSWDVCDQCVMNLFARVSCAERKAHEWSVRPEEYVKRAGFVVMARLASSDRKAPDSVFLRLQKGKPTTLTVPARYAAGTASGKEHDYRGVTGDAAQTGQAFA